MVRSLALLLKAQSIAHRLYRFVLEITMPKINLSGMTVEALMDLRERVDESLNERRAELQRQLERIAVVSGARVVRGGGSVLKGTKVPAKYRGPSVLQRSSLIDFPLP